MADERCVVCGLTAKSGNPRNVVIHNGKPYPVCCYKCRKKFEADAEQYLS